VRNLRAGPFEDSTMLVASLPSPGSLQASTRRRTAAHARTAAARRQTTTALRTVTVPAWLWFWLMAGTGLVACVPALRGDALTGATLPFWLVGAPLLDLAWVGRAHLKRCLHVLAVRHLPSVAGHRRAAARNRYSVASAYSSPPRYGQFTRSGFPAEACRSARSSST